MIIVNLKGGLGNQLFQLNAAIYLRKYPGEKIILYTSNLKSFAVARKFSLIPFIFSDNNIVIWNGRCLFLNRYLLYIIAKTGLFIANDTNKLKKPIVLDGYFQNHRYFNKQSVDLLSNSIESFFRQNESTLCSKLNVIKEDFLGYIRNNDDYIGVHIRGTDRKQDMLNVSLSEIIKNIPVYSKNKIVLCFTDDIEFSKQLFDKEFHNKVIYMQDAGLSDIEDFYVISQIKTFVLCNSTFSIFARLLSHANSVNYVIVDMFKGDEMQLLEIIQNHTRSLLLK